MRYQTMDDKHMYVMMIKRRQTPPREESQRLDMNKSLSRTQPIHYPLP